ncbi:hypothetical protein ACWD4G_15365 [Streptomyces sp. NPDC002643]
MRSARMLFATAAATAVLAITAPGAFAADEWDHEDNGYSKEQDKDWKHDEPRGGVHTGGGALTALNDAGEWNSDHGNKQDEGYKDGDRAKEDSGSYKESDNGSWEDHGKDPSKDSDKDAWKDEEDSASWKGDHDKPRGGMHTGGGALASPAVTAGGMAVLAVAGTGLYAMRRKQAGNAA